MKLKIMITMVLAVLITGCANAPRFAVPGRSAQSTYLSQVASPGCLGAASINPTLTPPALYQGMVSCIKAGRNNDGVLLFALAGTYSYFDALRLDTDAARQAHSSMLGEALKMINANQQQAFWQSANGALGDRQQLAALCRQIDAIGKPVYFPQYVMQPSRIGRGAAMPANTDQLWKTAMNSYLHCATDVMSIR
ncbi:hypothetical protein [Acerihabitans arboris]|uniref:Uncharacterized protein n=1 Tax=Acerihabitans arboris TaxID=2691583 RepID=A0A845S9R8_9GAMM|nr:hypothetical protein [Acerihabitans arboris]NDL61503.1 hypothetical protein [Acerihabitans arboris]